MYAKQQFILLKSTVAANGWLVKRSIPVTIGSIKKSEIASTVEHVEIYGRFAIENVRQSVPEIFRYKLKVCVIAASYIIALLVGLSPESW